MKKITFIIILLLVFQGLEVSAKWFQQKTMYSQALQQEKTYYVGLPTGYNAADATKKYPVIIFLHGASVTATDMVNTLEPILDNFLAKLLFDKLFKVIFIIPDGSCEPFKGSFYTNSALYGNYEDYIVKDLVTEIGSKYKAYPAREKWSIMGHSMGGYGAMNIALKNSKKFIGVAALSGPLHITYFEEILPILLSEHGTNPPYNFSYSGNVTQLVYSMAGAFSPDPSANPPIQFPVNTGGTIETNVLKKWESHNPINQIREWKGSPVMAVFTYCGELDEFKLAKPNQMFSDSLDKYHLPHTYVQDPNGDHVNSLTTSLLQGINFLYQVMDTANINLSTKVAQIRESNTVSVYPNPASERIYITGNSKSVVQVAFYNLSGQVMMLRNINPEGGIDISNLPKGVYIVSLMNTDRLKTFVRMIKE